MGLSDIDEDEPVTHSPRPPVVIARPPPPAQPHRAGTAYASPATASASHNASVLDDLFGNMDVSGPASAAGISTTAAKPIATSSPHTQRPAPAAPSVLDDLFAAPALSASGSGGKEAKAAEPQAMIYVDGTSGTSPDDGTNLFDLSKPVKKDRYNNAESFLEAFERQGRKGGGGGGGRTDERETLAQLTRNKDDNKVRARLLALMNYYDVLGVASTASEEEIKRSYKKKALELHPDRVGRDQTQEEAELFKVITKANEVLSDPEQRRKYDESLAGGLGQPAAAPSATDWWSHVQSA